MRIKYILYCLHTKWRKKKHIRLSWSKNCDICVQKFTSIIYKHHQQTNSKAMNETKISSLAFCTSWRVQLSGTWVSMLKIRFQCFAVGIETIRFRCETETNEHTFKWVWATNNKIKWFLFSFYKVYSRWQLKKETHHQKLRRSSCVNESRNVDHVFFCFQQIALTNQILRYWPRLYVHNQHVHTILKVFKNWTEFIYIHLIFTNRTFQSNDFILNHPNTSLLCAPTKWKYAIICHGNL